MEQFLWTLVNILAILIGIAIISVIGWGLMSLAFNVPDVKGKARYLVQGTGFLGCFLVFVFFIYLSNGNEPKWLMYVSQVHHYIRERASPPKPIPIKIEKE